MLFRTANLSQLAEFDEIIDVRTPAEFAEDHVPGAVNCPVLSDKERITVGTLYKQVSPFEARKVGAALVARNIAHHLETYFKDKPKSWRPMIYCWRGGQRSGAMTIILGQVGWSAHKLEGGYKHYRRYVLEELNRLPGLFDYRVICGATGTGKSRLLKTLAKCGSQILDLEKLAMHRGSLLGNLPEQSQPSQKWFETELVQAMQKLDPGRPVFVEAESNKIGRLTLPASLNQLMHQSACLILDTPLEIRLALLLEDYNHFVAYPDKLIVLMPLLKTFHGQNRVDHWIKLIQNREFNLLVEELLAVHYDPSYLRALSKHYKQLGQAPHYALNDISNATLLSLASQIHQSP